MKRMLPPPPPDTAQASICISYINSRSFGPLDPYIEEQYVVTSLSKITDVLCVISCINHSFFLAFMQPYSSDGYFRCFLDELDLAGISYEALGSEPLRMCGICPPGSVAPELRKFIIQFPVCRSASFRFHARPDFFNEALPFSFPAFRSHLMSAGAGSPACPFRRLSFGIRACFSADTSIYAEEKRECQP